MTSELLPQSHTVFRDHATNLRIFPLNPPVLSVKTVKILPVLRSFLPPVLAIVATLLVGAGLILLAGVNPLKAYSALFSESLANYFGFGNTLTKATPLLLSSLGVAIAFRATQYNIGAEGQIYLGGLGSTIVGLYLPAGLPLWFQMPLALLAAFITGALWGAIPGYLKAIRVVNEVITTLLLNYIGLYLVSYLVAGPMKDPTAPTPFSPMIAKSAQLPIILAQTQAHAGIFVGLIAAAIVWFVLQHTPLGYQIDAVGQNPTAARYAGISVERTIILVMALSGGLAGLAGAGEVMGLKYRLFEKFSPGYGFDAIAIALLSRGNIGGIILTAFFFGALRAGANVMQRTAGVPVTIVDAIQGLTVLFLAISVVMEHRLWVKRQTG